MIERKLATCRGTGKSHGFGCGEKVYRFRYGLCKSCFKSWLLTDAGKETLEKATLKATKDRRELEASKKEAKKTKGIQPLLNSVKQICHEYIRLRDRGKNCVSCGSDWKSNFQAGHFYKSEVYPTVRFNELNIHAQCEQCNLRLYGNFDAYDMRLPDRIGVDNYEEVKQLARLDKKTDHKWDREELKNIRSYYRKKLKDLKS